MEGTALDRPDSLLRSALEKVVFFECRVDQLDADLSRCREEIARLRDDLSAASRREVAVRQELAAAESRAAEAVREKESALAQVVAAAAERERVLGKLIDAERIRQAGEAGDGLDLAAFISDLRAEVSALRSAPPARAMTVPAGSSTSARPGEFASAQAAAASFAAQGRLGITERDREELRAAARFETRSEETLFALSLRELSSPDPTSRRRAAQRLKALGPRAALPAAAAALNAEPDPAVLVALLEVVAAADDASALPLVVGHQGSPSVDVRLAALEATFRLGDVQSLARALADPSPLVRRRAAVLAANRGAQGGEALESAARDADPSVRRVAALGLAAAGGPRAETALWGALDDADPTVRRSAAKGLSRRFGPEVYAVADLDAARRRREIRRLVGQGPSREELPPATPETAPAQQVDRSTLESEIVGRVLAALRGQSEDDLCKGVDARREAVVAVAQSLTKAGRLIRRGQRYFAP